MDVDEEPVSKYDRFSQVIKELDENGGYSREADAVSSAVYWLRLLTLQQ
jgi:hypothetical protein